MWLSWYFFILHFLLIWSKVIKEIILSQLRFLEFPEAGNSSPTPSQISFVLTMKLNRIACSFLFFLLLFFTWIETLCSRRYWSNNFIRNSCLGSWTLVLYGGGRGEGGVLFLYHPGWGKCQFWKLFAYPWVELFNYFLDYLIVQQEPEE